MTIAIIDGFLSFIQKCGNVLTVFYSNKKITVLTVTILTIIYALGQYYSLIRQQCRYRISWTYD